MRATARFTETPNAENIVDIDEKTDVYPPHQFWKRASGKIKSFPQHINQYRKSTALSTAHLLQSSKNELISKEYTAQMGSNSHIPMESDVTLVASNSIPKLNEEKIPKCQQDGLNLQMHPIIEMRDSLRSINLEEVKVEDEIRKSENWEELTPGVVGKEKIRALKLMITGLAYEKMEIKRNLEKWDMDTMHRSIFTVILQHFFFIIMIVHSKLYIENINNQYTQCQIVSYKRNRLYRI